MAQKASKEIQEVGKGAGINRVPLQNPANFSSRPQSMGDGYDGTINADPFYNKLDALKKLAMRMGKFA